MLSEVGDAEARLEPWFACPWAGCSVWRMNWWVQNRGGRDGDGEGEGDRMGTGGAQDRERDEDGDGEGVMWGKGWERGWGKG